MPIYGDWIQDPDYVGDVGPVPWGSVANTATVVSLTESDAIEPADSALVDQVIQQAATDPFSGTGVGRPSPSGLGGTMTADVDFTGGPGGPNSTVYRASRTAPPFAYSAHMSGTNRFSVDVPADAIGVEYEGYPIGGIARSAVQSAILDLPLRNLSIDNTVGAPVAVSGAWTTDIKAATGVNFGDNKDTLAEWDGNTYASGGTVLNMSAGIDPTAVDYVTTPTDVTPHLFGAPVDGLLVLVAEISVGSVTLASYSSDGKGVEFGGQMSSGIMHYTLRPPRYRFIYEGVTPTRRRDVPPRHLYPRSAIDNTTVYPPASSRQRSNRTNGYV